MKNHKTAAKCWKERLERGEHISDVHFCISDGWINVTIEIIARYPDKRKGVKADKVFMKNREIEAIAFYDSYHNGLNMDEGGFLKTEEWKQRMSDQMKGKKRPKITENQNKKVYATNGIKSWEFNSVKQAAEMLTNELKPPKKFDRGNISRAARGIHGSRKNLSTYKGITFSYDPPKPKRLQRHTL